MRPCSLPVCLLLACGKPAAPPTKTFPPVAAANAVPPDSPLAEGQWRFLVDAWGTEAQDDWPPPRFLLDLLKAEPDVFGPQFSKFGFVPDPADDLPYGLKRGLADPARVQQTCAVCHVGVLPDGRTWLGAPNTRLELARFQLAVDDRWVKAGHPSRYDALQKTKLAGLGPGRASAESGSYPQLVAADYPAYFSLGQRSRLNYLGTGLDVRSEVFLSIFSTGPGSPDPATATIPFPDDARTGAFLAFFSQMAPPAGPAQDPALVASGKAAFAKARCGACHHLDDLAKDTVVTWDAAKERFPGDDPAFPDGSIATDAQHRLLVTSSAGTGGDQGRDDLLRFILSHHLHVGGSDGYRALDLHGLWATAPYLHNGSVPTLADLLKPAAERPATWQRGDFTVDTTVAGNSNAGHEFGTTLSADEKAALVAFLESL